jgi:hypothetical protein
MSVANLPENLRRSLASGGRDLLDPGTGGTVDLRGKDFMIARNFGAGTYKLPEMDSVDIGAIVYVVADGSQTWQNAAGSSRGSLASGDAMAFQCVSTSDWKSLGISELADLAYANTDVTSDVSGAENALDTLFVRAGNLFVPVSLYGLRIVSTMAVGTLVITDATPDTGGAGLIGSTTTPVLEPINGATAGCQRLRWASSNNTVVAFQVPLPSTLDDTKAITLSVRIASGGTTDAVGFTVTSYFGETGAAVSDTTTTNQTTTYTTCTATIAASDVPAGARTMTVTLTPVAHTSDAMDLSAVELSVPLTVNSL